MAFVVPLRTLNDRVEDFYLLLVENDEEFMRYLNAVWDEQAVEGSIAVDEVMAAQIIRRKAVEMGSDLGRENLTTLIRSLNVVLRRYGLGRMERRHTLGGVIHQPGPDGEARHRLDEQHTPRRGRPSHRQRQQRMQQQQQPQPLRGEP